MDSTPKPAPNSYIHINDSGPKDYRQHPTPKTHQLEIYAVMKNLFTESPLRFADLTGKSSDVMQGKACQESIGPKMN